MLCKECLVDKPEGDFYQSNRARCKECVKASVHAHRQANLEKIRAYDRLRGGLPHRVAMRAEYRHTNAFKASHKAANKRYLSENPKRRAAQVVAGNAVRSGRLEKLPCLVCGERAEAHHPDYDRPLDVVWLCPAHHKQAHALARRYKEAA